MKQPLVTPGRLDELAVVLLKQGARLHGNPLVRIGLNMAEGQLSQALKETVGPGTPAGEWAEKLTTAAREFERRFMEARAQIQAEDGE